MILTKILAFTTIYAWVTNKRAVMIICFVPLYDSYLILCDHFFSLLTLHCSFTSYCTVLCFQTKTTHYPNLLLIKHSICNKFLFIAVFLSNCILLLDHVAIRSSVYFVVTFIIVWVQKQDIIGDVDFFKNSFEQLFKPLQL